MRHFNKQAGFTLIEVAIVMPMVILLIAGMTAILFSMLNDFTDGKTKQSLYYQNQAALEQIENDAKLSSAFLSTQDPYPMNFDFFGYGTAKRTYTTPYTASAGGISYKGSGTNPNLRSLILRKYATDKDGNNPDRRAVKTNSNCGDSYSSANLTYNVIYFVRDNTLYKRTVTNDTTATCTAPYQRQSCPADAPVRTSANCNYNNPVFNTNPSGVFTDDAAVLSNVENFTVNYYQYPDSSTPLDVYNSADPNILSSVTTVEITITSSRKNSKSQPLQVTSKMRVSENI